MSPIALFPYFKKWQVTWQFDDAQSHCGKNGVNLYYAGLLRLCCIHAVKIDQVLSNVSKGVTPQEESVQSLILTPGSRLSTSQAEKVFSRLRVEFKYSGLYGESEDQQHVPMFQWPPEATEDSVAEAACQHLQSTYMPEDVVVIAVQSVIWMGHDWPESKVKIKETSRTDYVMVYKGLAPEMVDLLIDKQRLCAELKVLVSRQESQLRKLEDMHEESQFRSRQARRSCFNVALCHVGWLLKSVAIRNQ